MKMKIFILITLLILSCRSDQDKRLNQDFLSDFASENNRIAGDLYLDYFNEDLSSLTYDYYLTFITKNEAPSARGYSILVKNADYHYFKARRESFVIALYYKKERSIICDNSNTAFLDSLKTFLENDTIPELSEFSSKLLSR